MKSWIVLVMMMMAGMVAADFLPVHGGITWTYEAVEPDQGVRTHTMSGPTVWNSLYGHAQLEMIDGEQAATTHWLMDDSERLVLQGVDHGSVAAGGTWYFSPSPVFAAPSLAPGESITTTAGVYEVTDSGDQWYEQRQVNVECLSAFVFNLPGFGNILMVEQAVSWPDSPAEAPWAYGRHEIRTYGNNVGLTMIESTVAGSVSWELVSVEGHVTDVPMADLAVAMVVAPTPFNPSTTFKLDLGAPCDARLEVFDLRGRRLATLLDAPRGAGHHEIPWQARGLASGVYMARLTAGTAVVTTRATLLE